MRKHCPQCGAGHLFRHWWHMEAHCPGCGMRFEREEGFFLGVYFVNITITQLAIVAYVAAAFAATLPNAPIPAILAGAVLIAVAAPPALYPLSKTLWIGVHLIMQPLEPDEQAEAAALRFERGDAFPPRR